MQGAGQHGGVGGILGNRLPGGEVARRGQAELGELGQDAGVPLGHFA